MICHNFQRGFNSSNEPVINCLSANNIRITGLTGCQFLYVIWQNGQFSRPPAAGQMGSLTWVYRISKTVWQNLASFYVRRPGSNCVLMTFSKFESLFDQSDAEIKTKASTHCWRSLLGFPRLKRLNSFSYCNGGSKIKTMTLSTEWTFLK